MKKTKHTTKASSSSGYQRYALLALRVIIGWFFLYSGLTKLMMDPAFNSAGFLVGAKTFQNFYHWLASAENIGWVNFMNVWGQILIGAGLLTGTFTRLASYSAILMMALYYFPGLEFPKVEHGFLVDSHVIYAFALAVLAGFRAGDYLGVDQWISRYRSKAKVSK